MCSPRYKSPLLPRSGNAVTRTWWVATYGSDLTGDGTSGAPFETIQHAIDQTSNLDTVMVRDGTYTGPGNYNLTTLGRPIVVRSENGAEYTVLSLGGTFYDAHRGFVITEGEDERTKIVGFTVRDAHELMRACFPLEWRTLRVLGGATRSPYWMQLIADIAQIPIEEPACGEAAVFGGALLGGAAAGVFSDIADAAERFYRCERVYKPGADSKQYEEPYARYRDAMEKLYPGALGLA